MEQQKVWSINDEAYLALQTGMDAWDFTIYDKDLKEIDGGELEDSDMSIEQVRSYILDDYQITEENMVEIDYDAFMELIYNIEEIESDKRIRKHEINDFTIKLMRFKQNMEPYDYVDQKDSIDISYEKTMEQIEQGDTENLENWLQEIMDDGGPFGMFAEILADILNDLKQPVEKQMEKASILETLNNLKQGIMPSEAPKKKDDICL